MQVTKPASLTDQVVVAIRAAITSGSLKPGSMHSVESLAKELKVSRTPVREALVRLATARMVRFQPNVGVEILEPTVHDLQEILQLRLMLEPPAAYRAARRANETQLKQLRPEFDAMKEAVFADDDDRFRRFSGHDVRFHQLILEAANNDRQAQLIQDLRFATMTQGVDLLLKQATGSQDASTSKSPRSFEDVLKDHDFVLQALEDHKDKAAAAAMYRHVRLTGEMLLRQREADTRDAFDREWAKGIANYGTSEEEFSQFDAYPGPA